jgi:hypothetical protein
MFKGSMRLSFVSLLSLFVGFTWLVYVYSWASLVPPTLNGWERLVTIGRGMLPAAIPGVAFVVVGLCLAAAGTRARPEQSAAVGSAIVVVTSLIVAALLVAVTAALYWYS